MKSITILAFGLLVGCTTTITIQPYHRPAAPLTVNLQEPIAPDVSCQPVDEPPAVPPKPQLSAAGKSDVSRAYQEIVDAYRALRLYAKERFQVEHDARLRCTQP